jgi:hypothetical protein
MIDLIEIYVHWYAGRSQAQIADSLGLDRKTVRKYLAPVAAAALVAGGPPVMSEADWRARASLWDATECGGGRPRCLCGSTGRSVSSTSPAGRCRWRADSHGSSAAATADAALPRQCRQLGEHHLSRDDCFRRQAAEAGQRLVADEGFACPQDLER